MYWRYGTSRIASPNIPAYVCGETLDYTLTLVTEAGDGLVNAYLAVLTASTAGILQAKLHTESEYQSIDGLGFPTCWFGNLEDDQEYQVDFRISLPLGFTDGLYLPTVVVAYGADVRPMNPYFTGELSTGYFDPELESYFRSEV